MTLQVSSSPHIRDQASTTRLMLDVIIALLPALGVSIYMFGLRSLLIVVLTCTTAVLFEYLSRKLMKRYNSIGDLSAVVTGLLLAFNLPPTVPLYVPVIGSFVAVVVVKQMFGGIGQNFVNPALASRIILTLSFPAALTRWAILAGRIPGHGIPGTEPIAEGVDLIATATPLYLIQAGETGSAVMPGYLDLFIGYKGGCLGEVSVLALAAGVVYLLIRRVISPLIPVTYILTVPADGLVRTRSPVPHAVRRPVPGRFLHGDRLCHVAAEQQRQDHLRPRLRPDHEPGALVRRHDRRGLLCDPLHEYPDTAHRPLDDPGALWRCATCQVLSPFCLPSSYVPSAS